MCSEFWATFVWDKCNGVKSVRREPGVVRNIIFDSGKLPIKLLGIWGIEWKVWSVIFLREPINIIILIVQTTLRIT